MSRTPVALALAAVAALALPMVAVAGSGGFAPPDPSTPSAERIADLYWLLVAIAGFIFLLVVVPLVLFAVRYRNAGRPRDLEGPQIRGNTRLEVAWTLVPVALLVVIVAFVFYKLPGITDPARGQTVAERLQVKVEGRQFYWRYVYEGGEVAVDHLRLPVDAEVELALTAPDHDVLHSWWANEVTGKRDTIPGQATPVKIWTTREGRFTVRCGEFCGVQHAAMLGSIEVMPRDEFRRFLAGRGGEGADAADFGEEIWTGACAKCHGEDVAGELGPDLEGSAVVQNADTVRQIVRRGQGAMPPVGRGWSERELDALIAHLGDRFGTQEQGGGEGEDGGEEDGGDG